ncbi:MAG: hypothetical protein QM776_12930 [Rhodocyclaceae bacterium]
MSNGLFRRILAGTGANAFGQAVNIGIQLASLPLFLWRWDLATYGQWLLLSAVPAYVAMADVGMVTTAGNRMTMALGAGQVTEARRVFQTAQAFMLLVCGALALLLVPAILLLPLSVLGDTSARIALSALVLGVLMSLCGGLSEAVFKATGRYAQGTMLGNLVRLLEWGGYMLGLWLDGSFAAVALGGLAARTAGTLAAAWLSQASTHGLAWGLGEASGQEVRAMLRPALSFMVFPLTNAISFQGVTLLVGSLFGPAIVALFNTYRTIARVAVQLTAIFSHALWPEFSRLYGAGGSSAMLPLFRRGAWLAAAQAVGLSAMLYFAAPLLLRIWTHGEIEFVPSVMLLMLLYAMFGGLWHVPRILLMAINRHGSLALWTLLMGVACVAFAALFGHWWQLKGVVLAMLVTEVGIAGVCMGFALSVLRGAAPLVKVSA